MVRGPKRVRDETITILMADCGSILFAQNDQGLRDIAYANAPAGKYAAGTPVEDSDIRHPGGSNMVFVDGHAKSYRPDRLIVEVPPLP